MKNRLKKTLSILLTVVMAASVFTALPLTAGAVDAVTEENSLLLGDGDGQFYICGSAGIID